MSLCLPPLARKQVALPTLGRLQLPKRYVCVLHCSLSPSCSCGDVGRLSHRFVSVFACYPRVSRVWVVGGSGSSGIVLEVRARAGESAPEVVPIVGFGSGIQEGLQRRLCVCVCALIFAMGLLKANNKAGGAKRVTAATVNSMQGRISKELKKLEESQLALTSKNKIQEIAEYLEARPNLVVQAHNYICGGILEKVDKPEEEVETFPTEYKTLARTPKTALQQFLGETTTKLNSVVLASLRKQDSNIALRLFLRGTYLESGAPFGPSVKSEWAKLYMDRYKQCGSELAGVVCSDKSHVAWQRCGIYRLLPEVPSGTTPSEHKFTAIKLKATVKQFEPHQIVDGTWAISQNWSVKTAYMTSGGANPTTRLCVGHFSPDELQLLVPAMAYPSPESEADGDSNEEGESEGDGDGGEREEAAAAAKSPATQRKTRQCASARLRSPASRAKQSRGTASSPSAIVVVTPAKRQGVPGVVAPPASKKGSWVQKALEAELVSAS